MKELKLCSVPGCLRQLRAKTFCSSHYAQLKRGYKTPASFKPFPAREECGLSMCDRPVESNSLCRAHAETARRFNITYEYLETLLTNGCGICGDKNNIHVDHDHECCDFDGSCGNCVRGGLCSKCNMGLGALGDNLLGILRAVEYLKKNRV